MAEAAAIARMPYKVMKDRANRRSISSVIIKVKRAQRGGYYEQRRIPASAIPRLRAIGEQNERTSAWLTAREYARTYGISYAQVHVLADEGRLRFEKLSSNRLVFYPLPPPGWGADAWKHTGIAAGG